MTQTQFTEITITPDMVSEIHEKAKMAAKTAVHDFIQDWTEKTGGNEYGEPMYCGFANVKIRPAKGSFVKWLKERKIGDKGWNGGYSISYYDFMGDVRESFTQSMDLKEMGCDAFVAVLRKYGMDAYMESRAD